MKLIIIDAYSDDIHQKIHTLNVNDFYFAEIENVNVLNLANFEEIYLFCELTNCFISFNAQELITKSNLKMKLILIAEKIAMCDAVVSWLNSLVAFCGKNLFVCDKISKSNFENDFARLKTMFGVRSQTAQASNSVVTIYTDGACSGNPGPGGWGIVLISGEHKKELSGFEPETTNNRMELTAVVKALSMLKKKCDVELYSDSAYVVNAINQNWLEGWKNNGWKNSSKEPVKNIELWQQLDDLLKIYNVTFHKVKGHADNEFNNRCDELATQEIAKNQ